MLKDCNRWCLFQDFSLIPSLVTEQARPCLEWESKGKVNFVLCGLPVVGPAVREQGNEELCWGCCLSARLRASAVKRTALLGVCSDAAVGLLAALCWGYWATEQHQAIRVLPASGLFCLCCSSASQQLVGAAQCFLPSSAPAWCLGSAALGPCAQRKLGAALVFLLFRL